MKFDLPGYLGELAKKHKFKKRWQKAVSVMAAAVVFTTTYALILPAITAEGEPICGKEEHIHDDSCYEAKLIGPEPELVCEYADGSDGERVIHTHNKYCYDDSGALICKLSELDEHIHDEDCYTTSRTLICDLDEDYHVHTNKCYTMVRGDLICGEEETEGHIHDSSCYITEEELTCGLDEDGEHVHDDSCYSTREELVCTLEEESPHIHSDDCCDWESELNCSLEENPDGHEHTDDCYEVHTSLSCGRRELTEHTHSDSCYDEDGNLICGKTEAKAHQHTSACVYRPDGEYIETKVLICDEEEHEHTDECYPVSEAEDEEYYCGLEEHIHTTFCYDNDGEVICGIEEHTHTSKCLIPESDSTADVETSDDWEETLSGVKLSGIWADDLVAVAESQLGYTESTENYVEDADGTRRGYTRYGDWYGDTYGDWCAMFVSFCLNYAEIDALPYEANCRQWVDILSDEDYDLYREADEYTPKKGDLVFFNNKDSDAYADHVGIVAEYKKGGILTSAKIKTIEGNSADRVRQVTYELDDARILGYAELPENSDTEPEYLCGMTEHIHGADCYDGEGSLICGMEEHVHSEECLKTAGSGFTDEELAQIEELTAIIDALPSESEINEALDEFDVSGDEEGYEAYVEDVFHEVKWTYMYYQSFSEKMQAAVTNADKLLALEWIWGTLTYAVTDTVNVSAVNSFSWYAGAIIVHSDNGTTVGNSGMSHTDFLNWYAVVVEYENGRYVVKNVVAPTGSNSKSEIYASGNGFVLLFHVGNLGTSVNVNKGDTATMSSDFWKSYKGYSSGYVYGTVTFTSESAQKNYKDNSDQLNKVDAASTRDFIELNLYDYGSGSTGRNINDKFNEDKKMPGFQQSGGTTSIDSLADFKSTGYMNFGDIVTDDLADGRLVTLAKLEPQGINVVMDTANSPISRFSDVMYDTLKDGYPALADGTSLGYLFGAEDYSKKMNTKSIDGLFKYNSTTGEYSFNSRENFAQFNSSNNTFTLYKEIFTPNFIMYPFGNFMPFNDIVHDAKQVSQINEDYFEELRLQANYLYKQGKGDQYSQLGGVLADFIDWAQKDNWGSDWTAKRALEHYFYWGSINDGPLPSEKDNEHNFNQISLDRLYSLDYDVPSDFYFGMEMKMNFMQPKNGITGPNNDQDMVFYFTGDDDVWVYIDGVLFLDLSGIHRHVGGKIDFVNGVVSYYSLDTKTGDVSTTPYKTVKFSDLVDSGKLNEKGTFNDYSTHTFNFYYMERGSGSSVCRMNFNFPLLRKNSISVTKELTGNDTGALGNPDFYFQVMKTDNTPYFDSGQKYTVYDKDNNVLAERTTGTDGIFHIEAGETAVFEGIEENSAQYYVRELLELSSLEQYGTIIINGSAVTLDNNKVLIDSKDFKGYKGPVGDPSNGSTAYTFNNNIDVTKYGSLDITKVLTEYNPKSRGIEEFRFRVELDGTPLPVGTKYTVNGTDKIVETAGIIYLRPDETAHISKILAGSEFTVTELDAADAGYTVIYTGNGVTDTNGHAKGTVSANSSAAVTVTNTEKGAYINIPVNKNLVSADDTEHTFKFELKQVTDSSGATLTENGTSLETEASITGGTGNASFTIPYIQADITEYPTTLYYRITEKTDADPNIKYDESAYVAEVTVTESGGQISAALTGLYKDGTKIETSGAVPEFTNTLVRSLTVSKTVEGGTAPDSGFNFEINVTGANGGYKAVRSGSADEETVTFTGGKATVNLKAGETLTIYGLPAGADWTVTETTEGYITSYTVDGVTEQGMTATGTLSENSTVSFVNKYGYALPSTGGAGTTMYYITGGLLIAFGAALFVYRRTKSR